MELIDQVLIIVVPVASLAIGYFVNDLRYKKGKKILGEIRKVMDCVDNAVYDDKVTEEEFRATWENLKGVYAAIMA